MAPRTATLYSLLAGGTLGVLASFVPMVFGPLIFPQAISGPTLGEDIVAFSIPAFFLIFGGAGFFLAGRFLNRRIERNENTTRSFT